MPSTAVINAQQWAIGCLDQISARLRRSSGHAAHLSVGLRGERDALFELRRRGYIIVARRWTSPKLRGDLDLVGWDGEWLCFIEVKTRSGRDPMAPAETAVDQEKQRMLRRMAQAYLRSFRRSGEARSRCGLMSWRCTAAAGVRSLICFAERSAPARTITAAGVSVSNTLEAETV